MKKRDYDNVVAALGSRKRQVCTVQHLQQLFPHLEGAVLSSIVSQEVQKRVKRSYHHYSHTSTVARIYDKYLAAVERGDSPGILLSMARNYNFSPALLGKLMLEQYLNALDDSLGDLSNLNDTDPDTYRRSFSGQDSTQDTADDAPPHDPYPKLEEGSIIDQVGSTHGTSNCIDQGLSDHGKSNQGTTRMSTVAEECENTNKAAYKNEPTVWDTESNRHKGAIGNYPLPWDIGAATEKSLNDRPFEPPLSWDMNTSEDKAGNNANKIVLDSSTSKADDSLLWSSAAEANFSRRIEAPKQRVNKLFRDTALIPDKTLSFEVHMCLMEDDVYGPFADTIKHSVGHEYEVLLCRKLEELCIGYQTEDDLRAMGCDKTPDVKLDVPIAVGGHVVNWIESKASFGDFESNKTYLKEQFWSYWNRFGPGLVIYWFGFIDDLDTLGDKGIMLRDSFPDDIVLLGSLVPECYDQ